MAQVAKDGEKLSVPSPDFFKDVQYHAIGTLQEQVSMERGSPLLRNKLSFSFFFSIPFS